MTLLSGYKAANNGALRQIYPGRPLSVFAPSAFIDSVTESIDYTPAGMQRTPEVSVRFVQGAFDSEDTVDDQDSLVDGFIEYVAANRHAAGPNTLMLVSAVDDESGWVPEWIPDPQRAYFSSLVTLSAEGLFGGVI